ncbi:hypothetical protein F5Y15DRAFT_418098 [Xylariaceae sp. FL0016]|nr:hypothetical protein F5Y15DRAFT_418098 [Xylariaceae sp. FL0016]
MEGEASWFSSRSTAHSLPSKDELHKTHDKFKGALGKATKTGKVTPNLASTKDGVMEQIQQARDSPARTNSINQLVRQASMAQRDLLNRRQRSGKKVGHWFQEHLYTFSQFVESYSKVIELVASAGGPYSIIAYQTLSVFIGVCVNKVENDSKIMDMLSEIRQSLPRLDNWDSIYPTDPMRVLVAKAYVQIMDFAREATQYMSRTRKRYTAALFPGVNSDFDATATAIRATLADISNEAMYGLHIRSQKTEKTQKHLLEQNAKLMAQNKMLKQELEQQREQAELRDRQEDHRRLEAFEDYLETRRGHPGTNVTATRDVLMKVFPDMPYSHHVTCTSYQNVSYDMLQSLEDYRSWRDSKKPALFFLSGNTAYHGRHFPGLEHCWLSPFAIFLDEIGRKEGAKVAFFSALPNLTASGISIDTVLSSVVIEILSWKPDILRDHDKDLRRILRRGEVSWSGSSLIELLGEVLFQIRDRELDPIYIIVDRLDLCVGDDLPKIMDDFAKMITALGRSKANVKVAIIAENPGTDAVWHKEWLSRHDFELQRLFARQHWDQKKLTTLETADTQRPKIWSSESMTSSWTI